MKPYLLLLLALLLSSALSAQAILKTKYKLDKKEMYYVLKSDTNVKEGAYKITTIYDSLLVCSGFYKNNLRDSVWKFYSYKTLIETGTYKANKKIGVWGGYDLGGNLQVQYDYTYKKLISYVPGSRDSDVYTIYTGNKIQLGTLQQSPIYINGIGVFIKTIGSNIRYPAIAKENGIKGNVMISFKIDTNGHTSEYKVKRHLQADCDKEALRVMKLLPENWLPGIINGKPVTVEYVVPIRFDLAVD